MTNPFALEQAQVRSQIAAEHTRRDGLATLVVAGATVTVAVKTAKGWKVMTGAVHGTYAPSEATGGEFIVITKSRRYVANVRDVTEVR